MPGQKDEPATTRPTESRRRAAHAADVDIAELAETQRKLLEELSSNRNLRKRVGELETERDEPKSCSPTWWPKPKGKRRASRPSKLSPTKPKSCLPNSPLRSRRGSPRSRASATCSPTSASDRRAQGAGKGAAPRHASQSRRRSRRGFTKATSELNAAYDLIDRRAKKKTP